MSRTWSKLTQRLISSAVREDLAEAGDLTAGLLPDPEHVVKARIVARQSGVAAGLDLVHEILFAFENRLLAELVFTPRITDGDLVTDGHVAGEIAGPHAAVLTAERTLLNFLTRLSGVATITREFVQKAHATNPAVKILDTRKTLPGWRELDKYAVALGGGTNHRHGLYDAVLIKDNHLAGVTLDHLAEHVEHLIEMIHEAPAQPSFIEIEVDTLEQFDVVLGIDGIDYVLLDNFSVEDLHTAVEKRNATKEDQRPLLEASGGITLETIGEVAAAGVDRISIGQLTHSAPAFDWGLDL